MLFPDKLLELLLFDREKSLLCSLSPQQRGSTYTSGQRRCAHHCDVRYLLADLILYEIDSIARERQHTLIRPDIKGRVQMVLIVLVRLFEVERGASHRTSRRIFEACGALHYRGCRSRQAGGLVPAGFDTRYEISRLFSRLSIEASKSFANDGVR